MEAERKEFLDRLFATYKELLGDFDPSPAFVAKCWERIEARKRESWAHHLIAWSPRLALASVAVAALLVAVQWIPIGSDSGSTVPGSSYVDMLLMDSLEDQEGPLLIRADNGE